MQTKLRPNRAAETTAKQCLDTSVGWVGYPLGWSLNKKRKPKDAKRLTTHTKQLEPRTLPKQQTTSQTHQTKHKTISKAKLNITSATNKQKNKTN